MAVFSVKSLKIQLSSLAPPLMLPWGKKFSNSGSAISSVKEEHTEAQCVLKGGPGTALWRPQGTAESDKHATGHEFIAYI